MAIVGQWAQERVAIDIQVRNIVVAVSGDGGILGDQAIGAQGDFRRDVCLIFEYAA